jgi:hypothetical protein
METPPQALEDFPRSSTEGHRITTNKAKGVINLSTLRLQSANSPVRGFSVVETALVSLPEVSSNEADRLHEAIGWF